MIALAVTARSSKQDSELISNEQSSPDVIGIHNGVVQDLRDISATLTKPNVQAHQLCSRAVHQSSSSLDLLSSSRADLLLCSSQAPQALAPQLFSNQDPLSFNSPAQQSTAPPLSSSNQEPQSCSNQAHQWFSNQELRLCSSQAHQEWDLLSCSSPDPLWCSSLLELLPSFSSKVRVCSWHHPKFHHSFASWYL